MRSKIACRRASHAAEPRRRRRRRRRRRVGFGWFVPFLRQCLLLLLSLPLLPHATLSCAHAFETSGIGVDTVAKTAKQVASDIRWQLFESPGERRGCREYSTHSMLCRHTHTHRVPCLFVHPNQNPTHPNTHSYLAAAHEVDSLVTCCANFFVCKINMPGK